MLVYNKQKSHLVFNEKLIPMGSLVFDPVNKNLSMLVDERGLIKVIPTTEETVETLPESTNE